MKRSGRKQAAFTAGELAPSVRERDDYKYFWAGLRDAANIDIAPQGGLTLRPGLRRRATIDDATAARVVPFIASDGTSYDLVLSSHLIRIVDAAGAVRASVETNYPLARVRTLSVTQQLDTAILCHPDVAPRRLICRAADDWTFEPLPLTGIPSYDFGGHPDGTPYTNGVPAEWDLEFIGFADGDAPLLDAIVFVLTVSGVDTVSLRVMVSSGAIDRAATAAALQSALLALPAIGDGLTVAPVDSDDGLLWRVTFAGDGNSGDGRAISGRVVNKADAAILATKTTVGIAPGEPIISADRGWPAVACFHQQRLILGGLRALPNVWMASRSGYYFDFDERLDTAEGPFRVPMDTAGGEGIRHIVSGRNLLILTSKAEYWIASDALSKTEVPRHVQASRIGARQVAPVENEGALLFAFAEGGAIGEFVYTDVNGNYQTGDISLLAPHLFGEISDLALQRARLRPGRRGSTGNRLLVLNTDGSAVLGTLLRAQEVTAFTRFETTATPLAAACNGRNELVVLTGRGDARALLAFEDGLLLDDARDFTFDVPARVLTGLAHLAGLDAWVIGDGDVFGPFSVTDGTITLPRAVSAATVGTWTPPRITTLPLSRQVGPRIYATAKARIHSVHLELEDTTSVAIAVNGGPARDIALSGLDGARVADLDRSFTGRRTLRGLTGFDDDPRVTITQVRPGRLTLNALTVEAAT